MAAARSFRDLDVYNRSLKLSSSLFEWSLTLPREERYGLASQIRRSSRAVGAILAEAWGRRRYKRAFAEKLTQALGEAKETQAWLDHARECNYMNQSDFDVYDDEWDRICAMLNRMIQQAESFCTST
jgi:four helix bundle protein